VVCGFAALSARCALSARLRRRWLRAAARVVVGRVDRLPSGSRPGGRRTLATRSSGNRDPSRGFSTLPSGRDARPTSGLTGFLEKIGNITRDMSSLSSRYPDPILGIPRPYPRDTPTLSSGYPSPILGIPRTYPRDTPDLSPGYPDPILGIPRPYPRDTPALSSGYPGPILGIPRPYPRDTPNLSPGCPEPLFGSGRGELADTRRSLGDEPNPPRGAGNPPPPCPATDNARSADNAAKPQTTRAKRAVHAAWSVRYSIAVSRVSKILKTVSSFVILRRARMRWDGLTRAILRWRSSNFWR